MMKVLKYAVYDLLRSRWLLFYFLFYLVLCFSFCFLNSSLDKTILSVFNVVILLTPMVSLIYGIVYYYNNQDYIELLLMQPIPRKKIFQGIYLALGTSLSLCLLLGILIPLSLFGLWASASIVDALTLICGSVFLSFIFSCFAIWIGLKNPNQLSGFSKAILLWLLLALVYDGLFLLLLLFFSDYPLESLSLGMCILNPIDLTRIFVMLQLDHSSLMGYTGAVFNKFFGSALGISLSLGMLLLWTIIPYILTRRAFLRKDF